MTRKDYRSIIKIERFNEDGVVIFEASCPENGCNVIEDGTVHDGDEVDAERLAIGKVFLHATKEHGITFDE